MTTFPASSADPELLERVDANLARLRARIAATGRDPASVRVVAVTKTFCRARCARPSNLGCAISARTTSTNSAPSARAAADLDLDWHFLGALQTNKIARAAACADVLSGVSRAARDRRDRRGLARPPRATSRSTSPAKPTT